MLPVLQFVVKLEATGEIKMSDKPMGFPVGGKHSDTRTGTTKVLDNMTAAQMEHAIQTVFKKWMNEEQVSPQDIVQVTFTVKKNGFAAKGESELYPSKHS